MKTKKPSREQALDAVRLILEYIGEDADRPGLIKTPDRVIRAWEQDWAKGYDPKYIRQQTESILGGQFEDGAEGADQMICVSGIEFYSNCEHHCAEFSGEASIAYIPNGKILGLSKLPRIVEMFSRKLQVQERLTNQIADFIDEHIKPIGVGVVVRASHSCMKSRGVKQQNTVATTSALRGEMLTEPEVRAEFLRLIGR